MCESHRPQLTIEYGAEPSSLPPCLHSAQTQELFQNLPTPSPRPCWMPYCCSERRVQQNVQASAGPAFASAPPPRAGRGTPGAANAFRRKELRMQFDTNLMMFCTSCAPARECAV